MTANIYDFDGTIYNGDSSVDFFIFCFKHKISMCRCFPNIIWNYILYIFRIKSKNELKEVFFSFLKYFNNTEELVELFWNKNYHKIKKWYLKQNNESDIIISASPEFLLKNICERLKVKVLIATKVDIKTGKFITENCYGEEKVKRLLSEYPNITVNEVYTDSNSDLPLISLSKVGYMVNKDKITKYESRKTS